VEAIVLAGGLGTRLKSVVSDLPKPMAPVGDKPFLEYIFRYLKKNSVDRVILSVGYKWDGIKAYFGDRFEGMELVYSIEDEPLGTGGAIKNAMQHVNGEFIFIINGDTFFDVPFESLRSVFQREDKLLLSLKPMHHFDRYGCVESDEQGLLTAFTEKGYRENGNINGGIYLAAKNIFEGYRLEERFSFETFMEENFRALKIRTSVFDTYFIDIGIPEDYTKAQSELKEHL
jgi:D-glycero-alpha-D-manno-heptose 1-phosphate guanylyltransferase